MTLIVRWVDHEREPKVAANPEFPDGVAIDVSRGAPWTCETKLPYPAKRCGVYLVTCDVCQSNIVLTTAGRRDDPRSIKIACRQ